MLRTRADFVPAKGRGWSPWREGRASAACVGGTFGGGECLFVCVKVVSGLERGRVGGIPRANLQGGSVLSAAITGMLCTATAGNCWCWRSPCFHVLCFPYSSSRSCSFSRSLSPAVGNGNISYSGLGFGIRDPSQMCALLTAWWLCVGECRCSPLPSMLGVW